MFKIQAQSKIPTDYGVFTVYAFSENEEDWSPHLVWVAENTDFSTTVNVRFHSECILSLKKNGWEKLVLFI